MGSGEGAGIGPGWGDLPAEAKAIWARAEKTMSLVEPGGLVDVFLWEHSKRVVDSIPDILNIAGIQAEELDRMALFTAALYHDAGWIDQVRDGSISRWDILAQPTSDDQRGLGAGLARKQLADRLPAPCLETAEAAIRALNKRDVSLPEGQILAEADSLDEIGPMAFWQMARSNTSKGRGIEACIDAWHKRQEYNFWGLRLERFRFEPTRQLAEKRLRVMDQFIRSMAALARGEDLTAQAAEMVREHPPTD